MGKESGLREEQFFLYIGFYDYRVLGKKNSNFCIFFLNDADVENCDASRGFGYIYIYIYI